MNENDLDELDLSNMTTKLTNLQVRANALTSVVGLGRLRNLERICLGENQLTSLVDIENLTSLTHLDCVANSLSLSSFPSLRRLVNMQDLRLNFNQFAAAPDGIDALTRLEILFVSLFSLLKNIVNLCI